MEMTELGEVARLHAAGVARVLAADLLPCMHCGAMLHQVADARTDLWEWEDEAGSRTGTDPDVAHLCDPAANPLGASNPYDALAKMAGLMSDAYFAALRSGKACETPFARRVTLDYSALKVRMDFGMSFHQHRAVTRWDPPGPEGAGRPRYTGLFYHCGWPAWLRPSGWYCRECKVQLRDGTPGLVWVS